MVALCMYGHLMRNHRVMFHTDNQGTMYIVNKQSSQSPIIMTLVRKLVPAALSFNVRFSASYIEGHSNFLADKITWLQATDSDLKLYGMNMVPDLVPQSLQPSN